MAVPVRSGGVRLADARAKWRVRLKREEVLGRGSDNRGQGDALIEGDEPRLVGDGQPEQIGVGNEARVRHTGQVEAQRIGERDGSLPKFVVGGGGGLAQAAGDFGNRQARRIGGLGKDPDTSVLRQRAGGPAQLAGAESTMPEPRRGGRAPRRRARSEN